MNTKKKKVLIVIGTRPEVIKLTPLFHELKKEKYHFDVVLCSTTQHKELSDQMISQYQLVPDHQLNIMIEGQSLSYSTSEVITKMNNVLIEESPDVVLVPGDTTTTFAAAVAGFYHQIPVGHVESGLRTYDIYSPWPEEMNRQMTTRVSTFHFAPTEQNKLNLLKEQIPEQNIFVTGNTGIDALFNDLREIQNHPDKEREIVEELGSMGYSFSGRKMIYITCHRREIFGEKMLRIFLELKKLALKYRDVDFVFPVHLNPNVQKAAYETLSGIHNFYLLRPVNHLFSVYLLLNSFFCISDSGGLQEEGPCIGKPVLVIRDVTERPEAIASGNNVLTTTDPDKIGEEVSRMLDQEAYYKTHSFPNNVFGDGKASQRIAEILFNALSSQSK